MKYASYNTLINDTKALGEKIPRRYYDAIIGVPRSGMIPASIISFILDIPLLTPSELKENLFFKSDRMKFHDLKNIKRVLVVDDSLNTGRQNKNIREYFKNISDIEFDYAAIYGNSESHPLVKYIGKSLKTPRQFEWNVLNSMRVKSAAVDIDGVLCKDPQFSEKSTPQGIEQMRNHILNAEPRYLIRYPILALCTNRLEKYRKETETWLQKYGITYTHLFMSPHTSPEKRRAENKHGEYKAKIMNQIGAQYFIESSLRQSKVIKQLTNKPVFCVDTMEFV